MSLFEKKWNAGDSVGGAAILLENDTAMRGRNNADSADIDLFKLDASDELLFLAKPKYAADPVNADDLVRKSYAEGLISGLQATSEKGSANGYAGLDGSGLVPASQLPSYVDDVEEYADLASFPVTGETGKIYVALDTNNTYRWSGSAYVEISSGPADTDALAEGASNFYYTEARFDSSFSGKDTDDLSEGVANLYHTDARAKAAAVVNVTTGSETDQAASVAAMKAYVAAQSSNVSFATETITLVAGDITNGYVDLAQAMLAGSETVFPKGGPVQVITDDYSLTVPASVSRLTFAGDLLLLAAGDKLVVKYAY